MMRVLLTGASSFTGAWFARALAEAGAEVVAPCSSAMEDYAHRPRARMRWLEGVVEQVPRARFGEDRFIELIDTGEPFDLLCLHGARAGAGRGQDFDALEALHDNTRNLDRVLRRFAARGGRAVCFTSSIFEADTAAAYPSSRAIERYGLSKTLTWHVVRYEVESLGLPLGRFVIAHPFGPYENPGLTSDLVSHWRAGRPGILKHPTLVRDFAHVDRLAAAYASFVLALPGPPRLVSLFPSGFVESVAAFSARLARALEPSLGRPCELVERRVPSRETQVRHNTDPLDTLVPQVCSADSWARYAAWWQAQPTAREIADAVRA